MQKTVRTKKLVEFINDYKKAILLSVTFLISIIYVVTACIGEKYLYSDGANYFMSIITSGHFSIYPLGRATCDKLMQCFVIMAFRAGVDSIKVMGVLYGIGCTIWPAGWTVLAVYYCIKKKRMDLAYAVFLMDTAVLLFWGFFCQQESVIGFTNYILLLALCCLSGKEETKKEKILTYTLLWCNSLLCYHLNEYYCTWSVILAFILGFRCLVRKEIPIWNILLCVWHIFCAVSSYIAISARGQAPSIVTEILHIIRIRFFVLSIILLIAIYACNMLPRKMTSLIQKVFIVMYIALGIYYVITRSGRIVICGFGIRFAILGGGIVVGIAMFIISRYRISISTVNMNLLSVGQTVIVVMFMIISAVQYRAFNTEIVRLCEYSGQSGYIWESPLAGTDYYMEWTMPLQSIVAHGLRGEYEINGNLCAPNVDFFAFQSDINQYPDLSRYGITYNKESFLEE